MRTTGRAYVSEIHEYNGKTYRLPANPTYREASDFVQYMGIKTNEDEAKMRLVGYEALFEPKPAPDCDRVRVALADSELSKLAPLQAELVLKTCAAFEIPFGSVPRLITELKKIQEGVYDDDESCVFYEFEDEI